MENTTLNTAENTRGLQDRVLRILRSGQASRIRVWTDDSGAHHLSATDKYGEARDLSEVDEAPAADTFDAQRQRLRLHVQLCQLL